MRVLNIGTKKYTKVVVLDEKGQGNANHHYRISGFTTKPPSRVQFPAEEQPDKTADVIFQNGPIKEVGVNGIADVDLLAICIDRLEGFQSGDYKCDTNQTALQHLLDAVTALDSRTKEREARGVEGTNQK